MAGEFTRIVPTGAGTRKQMDGTVRVYGDVIVLYIDRDFAGRRATFESDGNGTMRIVFAQDGDYKVSEPISKHGPLRMTARQILRQLNIAPGTYQGRMEGDALYLNLEEMVAS